VRNVWTWLPVLAATALTASLLAAQTSSPATSASSAPSIAAAARRSAAQTPAPDWHARQTAPAAAETSASDAVDSAAGMLAQNTAPETENGTAPAAPPNAAPSPGQSPAPEKNPSTLPEAPEPAASQPATKSRMHELEERMMGLQPKAGVVTVGAPVQPLTVHDKFTLFYHSTYPWQFLSSAITAGIGQATDSFHDYGQGMQGYGKRYGASLADASLGAFFGGFVMPSLLHEDPRFYRMGSGPVTRRALHAALTALICHRDDGTTGPAYGKISGAFMATSVGNAYYPDRDRGAGTTLSRGALIIAGSAINAELDEFWPDVRKKLFPKHKNKNPEK
jgi:hypothetical protein